MNKEERDAGSPVVFSIVTVVYNGESLLRGTMQSVFEQTYPHIEYWVIDGASKDGTLEIAREYEQKMPNLKWISEKDRGLYDAMNKGLLKATGDFIQFLNCGDHLHASDTIEKLAALVGSNTDVLYGETLLVNEERHSAGTMSELSTRKYLQNCVGRLPGVCWSYISHSYRAGPWLFYMENNLCADFDWCIQILKSSRENVFSDIIITDYLMGGMSKQRHRQSLKDRFEVMKTHFGLLPTIASHIRILFRAFFHRILRINKARY
ncbi:MAG: glycosyltransferase family 2 protein [Saprospiraceae bacterium]